MHNYHTLRIPSNKALREALSALHPYLRSLDAYVVPADRIRCRPCTTHEAFSTPTVNSLSHDIRTPPTPPSIVQGAFSWILESSRLNVISSSRAGLRVVSYIVMIQLSVQCFMLLLIYMLRVPLLRLHGRYIYVLYVHAVILLVLHM